MSEDQSPITKQDLREGLDAVVQSILTEVRAGILASEQRSQEFTRAEILASEQRSQEFARTTETNMLMAFHGYAKGQTARLHTGEIAAADLAIRMAALEERMLNLECRRPPQ